MINHCPHSRRSGPEVRPTPATRKRYVIVSLRSSISRGPRLVGLQRFTTTPVGRLWLAATPHVMACDLNEHAGSFLTDQGPSTSRQVLTEFSGMTQPDRVRETVTPESSDTDSLSWAKPETDSDGFTSPRLTVAEVSHNLRTLSVRNCLRGGTDVTESVLFSRSCTSVLRPREAHSMRE